ncbi:unnamed protein product [Tetraodon nigroviridis]|uniref:(spotted green pufferfish) hypothetical protein n=1 Tax=Tetraodon nigroviridis TaxID=99883 RepID=Q4S5W6_TETNG|nr:unnamed protein product [Tetraodon nigroviridis]
MSDSPRRSSGDFAKKVQRQLSRGKEKVLQKLGKTVETRDSQFDHCLQQFLDQQTDGNRLYKDMRNYISAVRDMREASRRLLQSLFDAYDPGWVGEEDLGAIVEGEDLLWNDYEVKLLDQAVRTMESYVSQFPDVRVRRKGPVKHLTANKATYVFNTHQSAGKNLQKGQKTGRLRLLPSPLGGAADRQEEGRRQDPEAGLDAILLYSHPCPTCKTSSSRKCTRYGSLKRRTLTSPRAWKTSFSEFHWSYNPRSSQRSSFRSPEKPGHSTLPRGSGSITASSHQSVLETSGFRDQDAQPSHSEEPNPSQARRKLRRWLEVTASRLRRRAVQRRRRVRPLQGGTRRLPPPRAALRRTCPSTRRVWTSSCLQQRTTACCTSKKATKAQKTSAVPKKKAWRMGTFQGWRT